MDTNYLAARLRAALAVDSPECAATTLHAALGRLYASGADAESLRAVSAAVMRLHDARLLLTDHVDGF